MFGAKRFRLCIICIFICFFAATGRSQENVSAIESLKKDADSLATIVSSPVGRQFLRAVDDLPRVTETRIVYYRKDTRSAVSSAGYELLTDSLKGLYERKELNEEFYYYTRYGTPLAFVRPLDLLCAAGLATLDQVRVIDFGFGSIGQLRLLASLGARVTGIEVDPILRVLYSDSSDTGTIAASTSAKAQQKGELRLFFGNFPVDTAINADIGGRYDVFVSKNTLKRGYIHPAREVDPRMLVHLGVDDSTFVNVVFDLLKPGGFFLIYNLHPAMSKPDDEKYIPWSDGRCPFERGLLERCGFTVLTYDQDDSEFARTMGRKLGWDADMDLENDLFGTYTLLRK